MPERIDTNTKEQADVSPQSKFKQWLFAERINDLRILAKRDLPTEESRHALLAMAMEFGNQEFGNFQDEKDLPASGDRISRKSAKNSVNTDVVNFIKSLSGEELEDILADVDDLSHNRKVTVQFITNISEEKVDMQSKKAGSRALEHGTSMIKFSASVHNGRRSNIRDYEFVLPEEISDSVARSSDPEAQSKFLRRGPVLKEILVDNAGLLEPQKIKLVKTETRKPEMVYWLDNRKFNVPLVEAEKAFGNLLKHKDDLEKCLKLRSELYVPSDLKDQDRDKFLSRRHKILHEEPQDRTQKAEFNNEPFVFLEQFEGIPDEYIKKILSQGEEILAKYKEFKITARRGKLGTLPKEERVKVPEAIEIFENVALHAGRFSRIKTARGLALQKRLDGEARPKELEGENITPSRWFEQVKDKLSGMSIANVDAFVKNFDWSPTQKREFYDLILIQLKHDPNEDKDIESVRKAVWGYKKGGLNPDYVNNIQRAAVISALEFVGDEREKQANIPGAKIKRMLQGGSGETPFIVLSDKASSYDFLKIELTKKIKGQEEKRPFYIPLPFGSEVESYAQALNIQKKTQRMFDEQGSFNAHISVKGNNIYNPDLEMALGKGSERVTINTDFSLIAVKMDFKERLLAEVLKKVYLKHKSVKVIDWKDEKKHPPGEKGAIFRMQRLLGYSGNPSIVQELVAKALEKDLEPLKKPLQKLELGQTVDIDSTGLITDVREAIIFRELSKTEIRSIPEATLARVPGYIETKKQYFQSISSQFKDLDPEELEILNNAIGLLWVLRKVELVRSTALGKYLQKHKLIGEGK